MSFQARGRLACLSFAVLLTAVGCSGNTSLNGGSSASGFGANGNTQLPFDAFTPAAYTQKVKTVLTGMAATDAEIAQAGQSTADLQSLITQWQQVPSYKAKMISFLDLAFQQASVFTTDFEMQGEKIDSGTIGAAPSEMLLGNLHDMIAQTVLANEAAGVPFKNIMSGSTFMMTAPLATYYAFLDTVSINDAGKTVNAGTANFKTSIAAFTAQDFNTWVSVTIRQPNAGETTTSPTSLTKLTAGQTIILNTPRVGFFTTPTFLAGWQTNATNQARVTMNQALIVALNHAFDGTEVATPMSMAALDSAHAPSGSACFQCHQNLDPMRQFYRQAYSISYSVQTDPNETAMPGMFAFDGVSTAGKTIYDLGTGFANHPSLAVAWTQKFCTFANDAVCDDQDPEFQRIASAFGASQSITKLVQDLFSSPIVTYAARTASSNVVAQSVSVTKTDHLCPLFATRLGLVDPCGLSPTAAPSGSAKTLQTIATILPANGYSRGQVPPVFANTPTLFFRAGIENVCAILAAEVVDTNTAFPSTDPNTAVSSIVHTLMAVPASEDAEPTSILMDHYNAAVAAGLKPADAMQSTFVAGCMTPSVIAVGE